MCRRALPAAAILLAIGTHPGCHLVLDPEGLPGLDGGLAPRDGALDGADAGDLPGEDVGVVEPGDDAGQEPGPDATVEATDGGTLSCRDGKQGGDESDVDCGGSCPRKCHPGQRCNADQDCSSGDCSALSHTCLIHSADDLTGWSSSNDQVLSLSSLPPPVKEGSGAIAVTISGFYAGDGRDGHCVVEARSDGSGLNISEESCAGRGAPDAPAYSLKKGALAGEAEVVIDLPDAYLAAGDRVMIVATEGSAAGQYELRGVVEADVTMGTVRLDLPLRKTYPVGSGAKAELVRVPQYSGLEVEPDARLIMAHHDCATGTGGIMALMVSGTARILGVIGLKGKGYKGGVGRTATTSSGLGMPGGSPVVACPGAAATTNNGGGGGGGAEGTTGGGAGGGGSGAGYAETGVSGKPSGSSPGSPYGSTSLDQLHLGSGGGSGGTAKCASCGSGANGGAGAGSLLLMANAVTTCDTSSNCVGRIVSDGANGQDASDLYSGAGGGGSGGSIRIEAKVINLGNGLVTAKGSLGGSSESGDSNGGGGSEGRIAIYHPAHQDPTESTDPTAARLGTLSGASEHRITYSFPAPLDLSGVTSVTFWARSSRPQLKMRISLQQDGGAALTRELVTLDTEWQHVTWVLDSEPRDAIVSIAFEPVEDTFPVVFELDAIGAVR